MTDTDTDTFASGPDPEPNQEGAAPPPLADFGELEKFRIENPREIGSVLKQLLFARNFVGVWYAGQSRYFVSRILSVDMTAGIFFYDLGSGQSDSAAFLDSEEGRFAVAQEGVRIQFACRKKELRGFEGGPAYCSPLPESLYRMQRRDFFRVRAPVMHPYHCMVRVPDGRQMRFDIFDLSMNGVGLHSKDPSLAQLQAGTVLERAVLDFREWGKMQADLEITYLHNIRTHNDPLFHFGCRFRGLPAAKEADLQRLITRLELLPRSEREQGRR